MASNNENNNNRNRDKHLFYLNELSDYKVSSDDPDVRGWKVKDVDNRVIGKVDNLLVNKQTERVVYLDVEVDKSIIEAGHDPYKSSASEGVHDFINKDGENHIIIPVGLVKLNEDDKFVYTDKVNHRTFAETKRMEKGSNVNREYEVVVLESYDRDTNYSSDPNRTSGDRNTITNDRDKDGERNTATKDRDSEGDRETKLTGDNAAGRSNRKGTDLGDSDVSRSGSTVGQTKESRSGHEKVNNDDNHSGNKRTDFAQENRGDSDLGNSKSKTGSTSGKKSDFDKDTERRTTDSSLDKRKSSKDDDNEDFYNKKDFDDSNYRRKK